MVLMALDHVRDFFTDVRFDPLDLAQTSPALFFTRIITHFCAPTFVFLAGTGAFFYGMRGRSKGSLSWFLASRGIWLVVLELTVIRFGWLFNLEYGLMIAQVIWAIGWSMVVMAALVHLRIPAIALLGLVMVAGHNLLDGIAPESLGSFSWLWRVLHAGGPVFLSPERVLAIAYPLVPWIGVMALGFAFGTFWLQSEQVRKRRIMLLGLSCIILFVAIRLLNIYGDPHPWQTQQSTLFTFLSFLNTEKYPPSLLYLLMTLGPSLLLLGLLESGPQPLQKVMVTFGRVPLFYYLLHIYLIRLAALFTAWATGLSPAFMVSNIPPWEWTADWGFPLPVVYAVWVLIVAALYPACAWYANLKKRSRNPLLSYL